MLQKIRNNAQSTVAKGIVALMIVPFVLFGIDSFFAGGGEKNVAEVEGVEISERQLLVGIDNQKRRLQAQMGDSFDPNVISDALLKPQVLESLVQQQLFASTASDLGLVASDKLIDEQIVAAPDFQEDGQFSSERYSGLLRANGLLPSDHRRQLRSQMASTHLRSGFLDTDFATAKDIAVAAKISDERRDIRYISVPAVKESELSEVTDDEVAAYYAENEQSFMREDQVQLEYLELQLSDFFAAVDDAEVMATYEREKAAFEPSSDTSIAHILVEVGPERTEEQARARIAEVQEKLSSGTSFAALAAEYSDDSGSADAGGDLGYVATGVFPEFDVALQELEKGQLSDPVTTASGLHLLKVLDKQEASFASFEDSKARITRELQAATATPDFIARIEELEDETFGAEGLQQAAEVLELEVKTSEFFARATGNGVGAYPAVRALGFSEEFRTSGVNSEKIDLGDDRVIVARLKEFKEGTPKPLLEVAPSIRADLLQSRLVAENKASAEKILAEVKAADSVENAAKAAGLDWQLKLEADRNTLELDRALIQAAFAQDEFDAAGVARMVVQMADNSYSVIEVANVQAGNIARVADSERAAMRGAMAQLAGTRSFENFFKNVRDTADVVIAE